MRSKRAIYNILSNFTLQIIIVIYGFIVPKIIISQFGSNVNGLISSITHFLGYIVLLESGFGPVVKSILYKPISKKDKPEIENILATSERFFKNIAKIFLLYIIILSFAYPLFINKEFDFVFTFSLILIISISSFAEYFFGMTYNLYLQANQKNYIVSLIQIILYIANIVVIFVLVKFNASVHVIKLATCLVFTLRPLFQNYYVKKKYNISLKKANSNYKIPQKWDGLVQHIAYVIHCNTDVTVLTIFCNLIEVSVYSVYYLVVKGIKSLIQSFCSGIDASFGDMLAKNEHEQLNKNFELYEVLYNTLCTIIYSCTAVLIVSFVSVYTRNIIDANYVRYTFGFLLVLGEYIWAIRLPYSSITLAAGHFKETKVGSWVEAIVNIVVSIILVGKYGIIGVAIGTCVAMFIRTLEYVYHVNKYILKRSIFLSVKKHLLIILETAIIFVVSQNITYMDVSSYIKWGLNAILVFVYSTIIVIAINSIFYGKSYLTILKKAKNVFRRNK